MKRCEEFWKWSKDERRKEKGKKRAEYAPVVQVAKVVAHALMDACIGERIGDVALSCVLGCQRQVVFVDKATPIDAVVGKSHLRGSTITGVRTFIAPVAK